MLPGSAAAEVRWFVLKISRVRWVIVIVIVRWVVVRWDKRWWRRRQRRGDGVEKDAPVAVPRFPLLRSRLVELRSRQIRAWSVRV